MCEHEELLNNGEFVCIKCGIVLDQEYVHEDVFSSHNITTTENIGLNTNIYTILDHLNLDSLFYHEEISDLIDKYLSSFKCKIELKIGACIYNILSEKGLSCQLNRISALVCSNISEQRKLFKLIQILPPKKCSIK